MHRFISGRRAFAGLLLGLGGALMFVTGAATSTASPAPTAAAKKRCNVVVKKARGKKQHVRVCKVVRGKPRADLAVRVVDSPSPVAVLSYAITVRNNGPARTTGGRFFVEFYSSRDSGAPYSAAQVRYESQGVTCRSAFSRATASPAEHGRECLLPPLRAGASHRFVLRIWPLEETWPIGTVVQLWGKVETTLRQADPKTENDRVVVTTTVGT